MPRGIPEKHIINGVKSDLRDEFYAEAAKREASRAEKAGLAKQLMVTLDKYALADAGYLKAHIDPPLPRVR